MTDVLGRLTAALKDRYAIERELGSGGMATVYLAEDLKHHRNVAIKVLRPELAAALGPERFLREIEIAARLNHPHILPLFDSGEADGFLFYVMPYAEGESLRDRLIREKQLPVDDALQISREVADALGFAHSRDVVHRDIKPENILLEAGHAVVADFGIARAISVAGGERLTETGILLGTPHYMSPEQGAGSREVDGRSDVYSLGCVLYEMLAGQPPFTGPTVESVVHQHLTVEAPSVINLRPAVPAEIAGTLARALAKTPADRFSAAAQFADALGTASMITSGVTPPAALPHSRHPVQAAGLFGIGSLALLGLVYLLMLQLGLPDWVFAAAMVLVVVSLPITMATALVERQRATGSIPTPTSDSGSVIRPWLTWRNAVRGGVVAFVALALVTVAYTAMRSLGIGPIGTLMATGVLEERDRIIVADFENRTSDSTLGPSITELLRIDLGQSPAVRVMDASAIAGVLRLMERDAGALIDLALAREVAAREGLKAIVAGQVAPLGAGFVLSARLASAADGETLVAVRETARDLDEIIPAVDRLSAKLRERIGESLRTVRATEPLWRATTSSLEALRSYSRAMRAYLENDFPRTIELLERAVAVDTAFAMAYRKLAQTIGNAGGPRSQSAAAATKAYEHRDRLPELERYLAAATYYEKVDFDRSGIIAAYRSALEVEPEDFVALINLSFYLTISREWEEAEELALRGISMYDIWNGYAAAVFAQAAQQKFAAAEATLTLFAERSPGHPRLTWLRALLASKQRDYGAAEVHYLSLKEAESTNPFWQWRVSHSLGALYQLRGRLRDAERYRREHMAVSEERGSARDYLHGATDLAWQYLLYRESPAEAVQVVEAALAQHPLGSMPATDRPYLDLAYFYASADRPERAKRLLAEYETQVDEGIRRHDANPPAVPAAIALAEGRVEEAISGYREWNRSFGYCTKCGVFALGRAYEMLRAPDSALAYYERAISEPGSRISFESWNWGERADFAWLPRTYKRLGELYEERGDQEKAIHYYNEFVELWRDADEELQPQVREIRQRLVRLVGERE